MLKPPTSFSSSYPSYDLLILMDLITVPEERIPFIDLWIVLNTQFDTILYHSSN